MKAIKRKFLNGDEILSFNKKNNFEVERYFNPSHFSSILNETINLWFDHSYDKIADFITIETIYYDPSRSIENYESFEFFEQISINLPHEGILKNNEFSIPLKIKSNSKFLWKIKFKITPGIDSNLHISLSV